MRAKLFVYGTLMRGERAAGLLEAARFVCEARTEARFTLVSMGDYPALVEGGTTAVAGELYEVSETLLGVLDDYEDAPGLYERARITVAGEAAQVYLLPQHHAAGRRVLHGGDWRKR